MMSEPTHLYACHRRLRFSRLRPWPAGYGDVAVYSAIFEGPADQVFGEGYARDFTFIDDIVTGVVACLDNPPPTTGTVKAGGSKAPHRLYNIGNHDFRRRAYPHDRLDRTGLRAAPRKSLFDADASRSALATPHYALSATIQRESWGPASSLDHNRSMSACRALRGVVFRATVSTWSTGEIP
jgi:nucleoside-diphosphate-sugar epimerase